jgi:hypothetical protein
MKYSLQRQGMGPGIQVDFLWVWPLPRIDPTSWLVCRLSRLASAHAVLRIQLVVSSIEHSFCTIAQLLHVVNQETETKWVQ